MGTRAHVLPLFGSALLCAIAGAGAASSAGRRGSLDSTFGAGGTVAASVGAFSSLNTLTIQPDGKLVAAGTIRRKGGDTVALIRFLPNGSLDRTFGRNGREAITVGPYCCSGSVGGLVVQSDGKLVVAGTSVNDEGTNLESGFVLRTNPDGSPDATFGKGGKVGFTNGREASAAHAVILQPDGKIVVGGEFVRANPDVYDTALARYDPNGSLDRSFGRGGTAIRPRAGAAYGLVLQRDGKLVAAAGNFILMRFRADGSLDPGFGRNGKTTTPMDCCAEALALEPDGRIVVAGSGENPDGSRSVIVLMRYTLSGSLDRSFSGNGIVLTAFPSFACSGVGALVVQRDGNLVAGGYRSATCADAAGNFPLTGFALLRYRRNGVLDRSFGTNGLVTTALHTTDGVDALALQSDGKLVAAGSGIFPGSERFVLARYLP